MQGRASRQTSPFLRWAGVFVGTLALAVVLGTGGPVMASGQAAATSEAVLHVATPQQALSPEVSQAIDQLIQSGIQQGKFPGAVVLVARNGAILKWQAYGDAYLYGPDGKTVADPVPMTKSTLFDLASITKMFTTVAVMQLVEQGKIALDQPVASYLPEFAANGKETVTVEQLLTHTSGLPDWGPFYRDYPTPSARIEAILSSPLKNPPGTKYLYSDLGYITLGLLVQKVSGLPLDRYIEEHICGPLGLTQTMFDPPAVLKPWCAATEAEPQTSRPMVWGQVHDENAWALEGVAGHAGLFSTAHDLAIFAQALLNGGAYQGQRILQEKTVEQMLSNQMGAGFDPHGLGWELNESWYMGNLAKHQAFGHTGFTGTSLVADRESGCIVILLTNRVHPSRDRGSINPWRKGLADLVEAAVSGGQ